MSAEPPAPLPPSSGRFRAQRLAGNPIIHPNLPGLAGEVGQNINGPSLIRVPEWIANPLGRYYLYFAHHNGAYIRLAYADNLAGPWQIYPPGVLHMDQGPGSRHIASPDVHIDDEARQIRMYFHQPAPEHRRSEGQLSYVAHSGDGLAFTPRDQVLGLSYFRVFQHGGWYYALAKNFNTDGILYRSRDGLYPFETGPSYIPRVRHTAVWTEGSTLFALYSRIGDTPESILLSTVDLKPDWHQWQFSSPELVLAPQTPWEGAEEKMEPSRPGAKNQPVHQVRDPAVFSEAQKRYLLYSVAGEQGIAIARLEPIDT